MRAINKSKPLIAVACGGTGGHLFPGMAVADVLRQRGVETVLILSDKAVDQQATNSVQGHEVLTLPSVAWQRGTRAGFAFHLARAWRQSRQLFKRRRPRALLAMGGFTSLAPAFAAFLSGTPFFLHESNAVPGRAIRWLAPLAREVFLGLASARKGLRGPLVTVTGTPVRSSFRSLKAEECRLQLGLDPALPTVLVTGGSQGALGLNRSVRGSLALLRSEGLPWQFIHLCGFQEDRDALEAAYRAQGFRALVRPFLDRMDWAMGAATVAIGRSGASFLAELAAVRLPSLLVPFPGAVDDHQLLNAQAFVEARAAFCREESELTPEWLRDHLRRLMSTDQEYASAVKALVDLDRPNAAVRIADHVSLGLGFEKGLSRPDENVSDSQTTLRRRGEAPETVLLSAQRREK